jgi:hypothetical protein
MESILVVKSGRNPFTDGLEKWMEGNCGKLKTADRG